MTRDNIFEELRAEHDRHRRLMEQINTTTGASPERKHLWREFVEDAEAHASAEELVFYSRLIAEAPARGTSAHSIEEHQAMRDLVSELTEVDMVSPTWLKKFYELQHKFEHHMREEEQGVFQLAGKVLSEREKSELVRAFRDAKRAEMIDGTKPT